MKNHFASAATLCLLLTILFSQHSAFAQSTEADTVTSGTLHFGTQATAPLLSTEVTMSISGMLVRTALTQRFTNDTAYWQEGIYVFPLPDDASVDTLEMKIGERIVKGTIQTREQAARQYETARAQGKKASLVGQQRANLFTTRVANIPPGESIDITIEFQSAVHYDDGIFSTHFPLTITPRYIPGSRLAAEEPLEGELEQSDAGWSNMSGITPPVVPSQQAARTTITVDLNAGLPLQSITSNTHQIIATEADHAEGGGNRWQVQLAASEIPMDRDFILQWAPPMGQSPRAAVFREDRIKTAEGATSTATTSTYASIMLLPPQQLFDGDRPAREVIFVIDTSGSMQGESIVQARKALAFGIDRLSDQDTFNVIEFDNDASALFNNVQPANTANRTRAIDWVNRLYADGGTEIAAAMKLALKNSQSDAGRLRQIVFVTDGSVGNEEEIFHYIDKHLGQSRLFTVGIGYAPNTWFMRKASEAGRGSYVSIANTRDVSNNMLQLFNKLERPVLTDVQLDVVGADNPERYPLTIPDLYAGEPIEADLRWENGLDNAEIIVSGEHAGQAWHRKLNLPDASGTQSQLAKRFAYKKIESLEDNRLFSDNPAKIETRITDIALDYGLVTAYTSLIAVEEIPARDPTVDALASAEVPTAMPAGNTMAFPQGSLGLVLRWILALVFSALSVIFALATLQQVRSYAH
ncbi:MAG: marine proteobacterial sortase target protein [Pseudomonadota bacterium]